MTRGVMLGLIALGCLAAGSFLPIGDWTIGLAEQASQAGARGVALFIVAYVVGTVAFLPGSMLTLAAGFAYGPLWGLAIASPASVAGAACTFLLGRTLLHDWAARKLAAYPAASAIDRAVEREGFKLVFLLRLSPLFPFSVLNYALSLSRVSLTTYISASFVGMLPGTALYVYLGSLAPAAAELSSASGQGSGARTFLYLAGFLATVAVVVVGTRAAKRALTFRMPEARE